MNSKEEIRRRIELKRQLIELTEKEITELERKRVCPIPVFKHDPVIQRVRDYRSRKKALLVTTVTTVATVAK